MLAQTRSVAIASERQLVEILITLVCSCLSFNLSAGSEGYATGAFVFLKIKMGKKLKRFLALLTLSSFHPMSGGKQITNESTHNPAMRDFARRVDIILGYVTGRVTAT